jgi:hypothetical protein
MGTLPELAAASAPPPARPHWLTAERLTAYPLIVLMVCLATSAGWIIMGSGMLDPRGSPIGTDFVTFWAASHLALTGEPAAVYDVARIAAAEQAAVPGFAGVFTWHYPPTFLLVVLPLALLPYLAAYAAFVGVTGAMFAAVMWRIAANRQAMLLLAAFPGVLINVLHGQNGFLTTAILGAGLLAVDRRPLLGGALFGLMAYKPHFAMLVPVALLAARSWHAIAAAAAVAVAFVAASTAIFGIDMLTTFVSTMPFVREMVESGMLPWHKMATTFAMMRLLGAATSTAYALQALAALAAIAGIVVLWRRPSPLALRGAMLITATMFATPYMFDYDMVLLALPIAWLALDGMARGWQPCEREILVAAWVAPVIAPGIANATHLQLAPLVTIGLFVLILRRWQALTRQDCPQLVTRHRARRTAA